MAAIFAASADAETVLLERTPEGGRKILISGGGRCNILPARHDESRFVTDSSPHTLRRMLRAWPLTEQIAFFERGSLKLSEESETESSSASNAARRAGRSVAWPRGAAPASHGRARHGLTPLAGGWRVDVPMALRSRPI
jgi:hypothetical protein